MTKSLPAPRPAIARKPQTTRSSSGSRFSQVTNASDRLDLGSTESLTQFQADLRGRLLATFAGPEFRPPLLPSVALELMRLSRKMDVGIEEIAGVLERDQVLAAEVLKLAQSVAYSSKVDVRSIQSAVTRIGLNRASDMFLRAALESKVFRVAGYGTALEQLRRHSIATGEIGRIICRYSRGDESYAYMCGLLHDVGIAGAIIAITDDLGVTTPIEFPLIWPVLSSVHQQFTVQLASLWGLPMELRTILRHHHTFGVAGEPDPLSAVTVLAEAIACGIGYGFEDQETNCMIDKALELLGLQVSQAESIERTASDLLAKTLV
jgi:HD-like signal output (HDOD) protein